MRRGAGATAPLREGVMESQDKPTQFFRAELPEQLLRSQAPAIQVVLGGLFRILDAALPEERPVADKEKTSSAADVNRPHNVFLIDGRRGAGKTFTLLSVEKAIEEFQVFMTGERACPEAWSKKFENLIGELSSPNAVSRLKAIFRHSARKPAETIKVIFPGDLLVNESLMEFLFARFGQRLKADIAELSKLTSPNSGSATASADARARLDQLKKLHDTLQNEVEQGWYFANRFGLEALVRDSSDYRDLVMRWGEESGKAAHRIDTWRTFINDYLNYYKTETLIVLVDDSDVRQELTEDILHAIRMFLNHPRIVTVLAGNLKAMRDTLLYKSLERVGPAITALNRLDHPAAREWRRRERQTIDEYLEKVLPPAQRIQVLRPTASAATKRTREDESDINTDFEKIAGQNLQQYSLNAMKLTRRSFLNSKFKLAIEREFQRVDAPNFTDRDAIEAFLSWWTFANMYSELLAPQSARQMKTFADLYRGWFGPHITHAKLEPDALKKLQRQRGLRPKRLPVVLFDNPANFTLIQRLNDEDSSLSDWLRRQPLASSWSGRRFFSVDEREVHDGSFTYHYLRYRLDVGLGMPLRDNAEEIVPMELLPQPAGRKYMRRFFQPRQMARRHRRLGLSRWLEHAAIPGNCIYFHDLQALPDISFLPFGANTERVESLQSGGWEAELADRWHELIEDRHETPEDEYLIRYFGEIICKSLQHTESLSSAALSEELDPPDIMEKQSRAIYEHFLADELGMFAARRSERREQLLKAVGPESNEAVRSVLDRLRRLEDVPDPISGLAPSDSTTPDAVTELGLQFPPASPLRMMALYSSLITDLRRAWHAIRIYESSPTHMGGSVHDTEDDQRASLAVIANRDRMKLYRRQNIEAVLRQTEWGDRILDVFAQENVKAVVSRHVPKKLRDNKKLFLDDQSMSFVYGADRAEIINESQIPAEMADFERWTETLRSLGRSFCWQWPVHDYHVSGKTIDLENHLFEKDKARHEKRPDHELRYVMLKIFDVKKPDPEAGDAKSRGEDQDLRRENTRSARNIIWLLYGLAPSLPAVIHADIMSKVYEAELLERALYDADHPYLENDRPMKPEDREEFRELISAHYKTAFDEIDAWSRLVGSLAVLVRYIKIKCLHLDTALFLQAVQDLSLVESRVTVGEELFSHCGYRIESDHAPGVVSNEFIARVRGELKDEDWAGFRCDSIAEGLAVFPDVSPSTLFGDQWVKDILSRGGISEELLVRFKRKKIIVTPPPKSGNKDSGLSVNGIFGETEQWLWAANRTLRKLKAVLGARDQNRQAKLAGAKPKSGKGSTTKKAKTAKTTVSRPRARRGARK